jgi:hypothetical protein
MALEHETITSPYEVVLGRDGGRVVEVTIRAIGGAELTPAMLNTALKRVVDRLRLDDRRTLRRQGEESDSLRALSRAWEESGGELTDRYLAHLAVAYEEVSEVPGHRAVNETLAEVIGRPAATVKGHVLRARKAGFLTATGMGRGGGEATEKARGLLNAT